MSFQTEIRCIRFDMCMTQKEIAALLGISRSTYKSWEVGESLPSLPNLRKLKKYLPHWQERLTRLYIMDKIG